MRSTIVQKSWTLWFCIIAIAITFLVVAVNADPLNLNVDHGVKDENIEHLQPTTNRNFDPLPYETTTSAANLLELSSVLDVINLIRFIHAAYENLNPDSPLSAAVVPELSYVNNDKSLFSFFTDCYDPKVNEKIVDIFQHPILTVVKHFFESHFHLLPKNHKSFGERVKILLKNIVYLAKNVVQCLLDRAQGKKGTRLGLTPYAGWTDEELQTLSSGSSIENFFVNIKRRFNERIIEDIPCEWNRTLPVEKEFDWRKSGIVNPVVKNQGDCGSCYIFAGISTFESAYARKYGVMKSFSEQQVLDCMSRTIKPNTCNGGDIRETFKFIKNDGVVSDDVAPYLGSKEATCPANKPLAFGEGYCDVFGLENDLELENLIKKFGPMAIAIAVPNIRQFSFLRGPWDKVCLAEQINHAVVVVGWTETHWIIRNSWGPDWGVEGYLYLSRGGNQCNMYSLATVPFA